MVEALHLSYSYTTQSDIRFPDFAIQKGEHCLLLGESGSGKTTLLHLIGGLLRGYGGKLSVDGIELNTLSETRLDKFRGQKLGFIFQKNHLIHALSVEKNVLLAPYLAGMPFDGDRLAHVFTNLGLSSKRKSKVMELSQGQAQRVAIARAIIHNPSLILADEPTSALDDKNCDRVINLLLEVAANNNATLLIATHDQRLKNKIGKQVYLTNGNT